jgi:hypothetical protein
LKEFILKKLRDIELDYGIDILYACESGSRAWGFESPDSDYDVRFIYRRDPSYYLSVNHPYLEKNDVIELPIEDNIDINGWDIKKALYLFGKGNAPLYEWLTSPIVYISKNFFTSTMSTVMGRYFSDKFIKYYVNMASGNFKEYLKSEDVRLKKYFYVLRPMLACEYIEKYNEIPPVDFTSCLNKVMPDGELKKSILRLLQEKKKTKEMGIGSRIDIINKYLENSIDYYKDYIKNIKDNNIDWLIINELSFVLITIKEETLSGGDNASTKES